MGRLPAGPSTRASSAAVVLLLAGLFLSSGRAGAMPTQPPSGRSAGSFVAAHAGADPGSIRADGPTVVPGVPAPWLLVPGVRSGPGALAVPVAEAALADADAALASLDDRAADLAGERAALAEERDRLDGEARRRTDALAASRTRAREAAVAAYIAGGTPELPELLFVAVDPLEAAERQVLLDSTADAARRAVADDAAARADADAALVDLAGRVDAVDAWAGVLAEERAPAEQRRVLAVADLEAARHEADLRAGRIVVRSGDDGGPTPAESGNAHGAGWDGLRRCESGANYAIADATGTYRGAYQFDLQTWRGMGGQGDPAEAPPAEQDLRAELLFRQRGAQPWPICGANLLADPALTPPPPPDPDDPANAWLFAPPSTLPGGAGPPGSVPSPPALRATTGAGTGP